jgi:hypothetical protein
MFVYVLGQTLMVYAHNMQDKIFVGMCLLI